MFSKLIVLRAAAPLVLNAQQPAQMSDTSFHPVTMAEAIRLAKENNVSNIVAANSVRSSQYTVRSSRAALLPTLTATASQSTKSGDQLGQNGKLVPYTSSWTYNTQLSSQMTLFDAGKMFADIKTARANVAAAQATEVNTEYG